MDKQTKDQIIAEQRAADAARNSAVWNALKRTPGLLAGGPVDLANLVLGAITGKGMAGLIHLVRTGHYRKGQNIVFLHTGGAVGLYGYMHAFEGHMAP